jgi:hypothetical protein
VHADLAGIEHPQAENVAVLDRAGAHDLGEETNANAHQLARFAPAERFPIAPLLLAQRCVTDRVQGFVERSQVIAAVVFRAERRLVGELLFADQIAAPDFGGVEIECARQHIDHSLDEIRRLGLPERAAVGASGRTNSTCVPFRTSIARLSTGGLGAATPTMPALPSDSLIQTRSVAETYWALHIPIAPPMIKCAT